MILQVTILKYFFPLEKAKDAFLNVTICSF